MGRQRIFNPLQSLGRTNSTTVLFHSQGLEVNTTVAAPSSQQDSCGDRQAGNDCSRSCIHLSMASGEHIR